MFQSTQTAKTFRRLAHAVNPLYQVLIRGGVTDELTGQPPRGELTVSASISTGNGQLVAKTVGGGLFCCIGESWRLFPLLATQAAGVDLTITAPGYRLYQQYVAVPAGSSFPLPPLSVALQRIPIGIEGYVVEATAAGSRPLAQAQVRCIEASSVVGVTAAIATLRTTLHGAYAAGTPVRACQLVLASPGVQRGTVVELDGQTKLAHDAAMGDGLLYLAATLESLASSSSVPVDALKIGEGEQVEYHALDGLSDESGYYRLSGISGAQIVTLEVSTAEIVAGNKTIRWMIEYGQAMNSVDFRLLRTA